jgi:eukaryotic-like serine/threonine-protein kinase
MHTMRSATIGCVALWLALDVSLDAQPPNLPRPGPTTTAIWKVPGASVGKPAHDGDTAYFLSKQREVVAVATTTGDIRWRSSVSITSIDGGGGTAGNAIALAGDVLVAGDWDVVGLDRATGRRRWRYFAPANSGAGLFIGQASGASVFTGSQDGRVYAIDVDTGRLRWSTPVVEARAGSTTAFEPVVAEAVVAAGYATHQVPPVGGVVVLDADSGRVRWRAEFPPPRERYLGTNLTGGPLIVDDEVIASAGDGSIYAFDLETGAIRARFPKFEWPPSPLHPPTDADVRALAHTGRLIVAGSLTGHIVAYDVDTREERWRHDASWWGSTAFSLAADDRLVYVPFWSGYIIALDVATGAERWRFGDFTMGFVWAPVPHGDRIYASASRAGAFALATTLPEAQP